MPDENVPYFNKTKIVVCTTPWTPAVFCDPDTDPVTWTGFEIEVFRTTTTRMGLAPGMLGKLNLKDEKYQERVGGSALYNSWSEVLLLIRTYN